MKGAGGSKFKFRVRRSQRADRCRREEAPMKETDSARIRR